MSLDCVTSLSPRHLDINGAGFRIYAELEFSRGLPLHERQDKRSVATFYNETEPSAPNGVQMYVCTFLVNHLILQLVACRVSGFTRLARKDKFLAVPFWPQLPPDAVWPPDWAIATVEEFDLFSDGWKQLDAS